MFHGHGLQSRKSTNCYGLTCASLTAATGCPSANDRIICCLAVQYRQYSEVKEHAQMSENGHYVHAR